MDNKSHICVDIEYKSDPSVAVVCPLWPLVCRGPFISAYCKPGERKAVFIFLLNPPRDVPAVSGGQQDDSDSALLANHVPLLNYASIYCQDLFLIINHESERVLIKHPISHVGILTHEAAGTTQSEVASGYRKCAAVLED